MICCQHEHYAPTANGDYGFEVDGARITYGRGVLAELGDAAKKLGMTRAAVFIDPHLRGSRNSSRPHSLRCARRRSTSVVYTDIAVEPTDASFKKAAAFAVDGKFDGYVSIGGGSTMDTAKAADLYATYPADFMDYVNAPIGAGRPIPGPLAPAHRVSDDLRNRQRMHRHRDLRLPRDEREDRHPRARAAADAGHHRSRRDALAASRWSSRAAVSTC